MRNASIASLLIAVLGVLSLPLSAAPVKPTPAVVMATDAQPAPLDLNKADALTLQSQLTGIGKNKAEASVAYREENGAFASVEELLEIKGIGKALLERNRDRLTVN